MDNPPIIGTAASNSGGHKTSRGGDLPALPDGYDGPTEVTSAADLEEIFRFRAKVWGGEDWLSRKPDADRVLDRHDFSARHWVVRRRGSLVAAMRLSLHDEVKDLPDCEYFPDGLVMPIPPRIASFNRLVVDPAYRCQGIGAALDQLSIRVARQSLANALLEVVPPYRVARLCRRGFKVLSRTRGMYLDIGEIPATILLLDLRADERLP